MIGSANSHDGPWMRAVNSLQRIRRLRLLAIVPVLIAGIFNTGYQYLLALDTMGGQVPDSWAGRTIEGFGVEAGEIGFGSMVIAGLVHIAPLIFAALIAGGLWARIDAQFRHRPLDTGFIFTAFLLVSLLPPGASLLHVVYGMSFAMILAYTVFGGEGKTFLSPALVGAAAVQISFPAYLVGNPLWSGLSGYAGTLSLIHI